MRDVHDLPIVGSELSVEVHLEGAVDSRYPDLLAVPMSG